ncbi:hypothetical protein EV144_105213 [Flavobacterium sp. 270]|uniref:hypothetical protein n=1 Tax=Flavobacterium sp. 270 TaxID=2512114 RepID=UPI0010649DFC|nr:hypothetical protein [Flavobacterium sp. 270]TDW47195.1 hypothetical protein EV144_105213 [Flavobacterium sp. 270]
MKTKAIIILFLISLKLFSQETNSIKITDLELPNAPAFTILDYSPTIINTPSTTQAFTVSLINNINSSKGFPTDYALEFTPYWVLSQKKRNLTDYVIKENQKAYSKPYKNLSFSFAAIKKDTLQNVSAGIRTNLLTVNRKERQESVTKLIEKLERFKVLTDENLPFGENPHESGTPEYNKWNLDKINKLSQLKEYKALTAEIYSKIDSLEYYKPLFTADFGTAYNHFFDRNEFKSGKFGRYGAWLTLNTNLKLSKSNKNYLNIYQYTRYLIDEMNYDTTALAYVKEKNLDVGAKIELQFNDFAIAYEYINRTNQKDNYRSVGNLKYKINDQFTINGGFGKNFEKTDNLVTFLGISWGIATNNELDIVEKNKTK